MVLDAASTADPGDGTPVIPPSSIPFVCGSGDSYAVLSVYVDDILLLGQAPERVGMHESKPTPTSGTDTNLGATLQKPATFTKTTPSTIRRSWGRSCTWSTQPDGTSRMQYWGWQRAWLGLLMEHMAGAKRLLRYLRGTPDLPTIYLKGDLKLPRHAALRRVRPSCRPGAAMQYAAELHPITW